MNRENIESILLKNIITNEIDNIKNNISALSKRDVLKIKCLNAKSIELESKIRQLSGNDYQNISIEWEFVQERLYEIFQPNSNDLILIKYWELPNCLCPKDENIQHNGGCFSLKCPLHGDF